MSTRDRPGLLGAAVEPRELVEVRILGLPVRIWSQAQEHSDELLREFALVAEGTRGPSEAHPPSRLVRLVEELRRDYDSITSDQEAQLVDAAEAGVESVDLTYHVPASVSEAAVRLDQALDAADEYCAAGEHLLTLTTPPEALAFRKWFLKEFTDQIDGRPARTWAEWLSDQPAR